LLMAEKATFPERGNPQRKGPFEKVEEGKDGNDGGGNREKNQKGLLKREEIQQRKREEWAPHKRDVT